MVHKGACAHGFGSGGHNLPQRFIVHALRRQLGHVGRRGIVLFVIQPVGVCKAGAVHPQRGRPLVHPVHKGLHVSRAVARHGEGRVVAGLQQQTVEQRLQGKLLPRLQVDGGTLGPSPFRLNGHRIGQPGG
ncbi:hypothetical protein SDC9_136587 [bioreactor metagenome]|uniref:Uncharacterized protein n=1 Tax=bioreactor metagenome TaxID=1076179 RepID=A0A645DK88_9ZZZZ